MFSLKRIFFFLVSIKASEKILFRHHPKIPKPKPENVVLPKVDIQNFLWTNKQEISVKGTTKSKKVFAGDPQENGQEIDMLTHSYFPISGKVTLECPEDFTLTGQECQKVEFAKPVPTCPYGSRLDPYFDCIQVDSVPPLKICPAGFDPYLKGCVRKIETKPVESCPVDFSPAFGKCIQRRDFPAHRICPDGSETAADFCIEEGSDPLKASEPILTCPGGLKPKAGMCQTLLTQEMTHACPAKFRQKGKEKNVEPGQKCVFGEFSNFHVICPVGYAREKLKNTAKACVAEKRVKKTFLCPPGFMKIEEPESKEENPVKCMQKVIVSPTLKSDKEGFDRSVCLFGSLDGLHCETEVPYFADIKQKGFEKLKPKIWK
eukprot:GHVP01015136.1.p1 GENE.GHVP01015136.1~~GHVP01015136.1.p1  ORF type:complete len:375 (-),score=90.96 GHVP01015136.1:1363-2487(-)